MTNPPHDTLSLRIERFIDKAIPNTNRLHNAMRYSMLQGGKRLRPRLVYSTGQDLGVSLNRLDHAAAAIEMIHGFSLIHDDLPAMDDDELRRGQPTCHVKYDEATAILAGDALQTLAFETLLQSPHPDSVKLNLTQKLAEASGANNMILGQQLDMDAEGCALTLDNLRRIHALKTGALISCSIDMAATIASASPNQIRILKSIGSAFGLAFQIQDDILDAAGTTQLTGKTTQRDIEKHKSTYVTVLGIQQAKTKLNDCIDTIHSQFQLLHPSMPTLKTTLSSALEKCQKLVN